MSEQQSKRSKNGETGSYGGGGGCETSSSLPTDPLLPVQEMILRHQVSSETDIGGGMENQDDRFIWRSQQQFPGHSGPSVLALGVLDGHGREVGKVAANAARHRLVEYLIEHWQEMRDPLTAKMCLVRAHIEAHLFIKLSFKEHLQGQGWEVQEDPAGFLLKRLPSHHTWSCVHGGTSCSLVVVVGMTMYAANVGDSSGTLCTVAPSLVPSMLVPVVDAALPVGTKSAAQKAYELLPAAGQTPSTTMIITAEHSPESPSEFVRLRAFRPRDGDAMQPALSVVYDAPTLDKSRCGPVFALDKNGTPTVTNKGMYYKTVRKEWASLVSTPSSARFQDALAFTRSLGDLHLHTYGVTHLPEVQVVDLQQVFDALQVANTEGMHPMAKTTICVVLATDGVWDNWTYEDVTRFVMDASCLNAVLGPNGDGAERVAQSFMQRNTVYARRNFGAQADNATGIVAYFSIDPAFSQKP